MDTRHAHDVHPHSTSPLRPLGFSYLPGPPPGSLSAGRAAAAEPAFPSYASSYHYCYYKNSSYHFFLARRLALLLYPRLTEQTFVCSSAENRRTHATALTRTQQPHQLGLAQTSLTLNVPSAPTAPRRRRSPRASATPCHAVMLSQSASCNQHRFPTGLACSSLPSSAQAQSHRCRLYSGHASSAQARSHRCRRRAVRAHMARPI